MGSSSFGATRAISQNWLRVVYLLGAVVLAAVAISFAFSRPAVAATVKSEPVPETNGRVWAIAASGDTIYLGGNFTSVSDNGNAVPRNRLAAVDATSGELLPWNPGANADVRALAVSGDRIYAGGDFTAVGGEVHNRVAAIGTDGTVVTSWNPRVASWNPSADLAVYSLATLGSRLYIGGKFKSINNTSRSGLAAVDKTTGQLTSWSPRANGNIRTLAPSPDASRIYAGGNYSLISGESRPNLAALDPSTGAVLAWTPDPEVNNDYEVFDLEITNTLVHVAGGGRNPDGTAETFNASTGNSVWRIASSGDFQAVALLNGKLYFGGHFVRLFYPSGEIRRLRLLAVNAATGELDNAWQPKAQQGGIWAMTQDPIRDRIYAGGDFLGISGEPQERFARLPIN